jgi:prepilin-type N-terminal cleavage/methylation domain-containing protein
MVPSRRRGKTGFTLVEMLVSVAVLLLILTFTVQMMNSTVLSTGLSGRHDDADSQARMVLDRMSKDFAGMQQRKDLDFVFAKETAGSATSGSSDVMFFYSEAPAYVPLTPTSLYPATGPDPKSSVALVGYCINTGVNNTVTGVTPPAYCLQRLSKGMTWDPGFPAANGLSGIAFLTFPSGSTTPFAATTLAGNMVTAAAVGSPPTYQGSDPGYDVLSSEVFRMEFCFQVKNLSVPGQVGTVYSNYPVAQWGSGNANKTTISSSDPSTTGAKTGDRWYNSLNNRAFICTNSNSTGSTWAANGLADVNAIVVAIAILDTKTRAILTQGEIAGAAASLADFAEPGSPSSTVPLMATTWQNALNGASPTFGSLAGIPASAAAQIRIYQRYFYLNNH